jgi:hypothetical protein
MNTQYIRLRLKQNLSDSTCAVLRKTTPTALAAAFRVRRLIAGVIDLKSNAFVLITQ